MATTLNDVAPLVRDYARNQALTDARVIRAINTATSLVQSQLGLPGYEKQFEFEFDQSQPVIQLPVDYGEMLSLRYRDAEQANHIPFTYKPGEYLYQRFDLIDGATRLVGDYNADGFWQLFVIAPNTVAPTVIDTFDNSDATNWTPSGDADDIVTDTAVYVQGNASLRFNIFQNVANRGSIESSSWGPFNFTQYVDIGRFDFYTFLPNITNFTSVSINWGTDSSNYFKNTVTTQSDGSAFQLGWNTLAIEWNGAVQVGSPDSTQIGWFKVDWDYTGAFTPTDSFRIDYLRMVRPDWMVLTYNTTYKGTTTLGAPLYTFTALTDKFPFGDMDPSIMELVALQAAVVVNPTLLQENSHVRDSYKTYSMTFQKRYPKKRFKNLLSDPRLPGRPQGNNGSVWRW